ncbi:hypothetical protein BDR05DRAFT_967763 [Suillus weaverae]|nr:hypothetical protein BDR05DRAFT_967763 [Suillus weaverae]
MCLPRGDTAAAPGMERASMFLTRVHFLLIACTLFDATTAQIPVKSGFNIASLQDCREPNGSWNMTDRACHSSSSRHRMQQESFFLPRTYIGNRDVA